MGKVWSGLGLSVSAKGGAFGTNVWMAKATNVPFGVPKLGL